MQDVAHENPMHEMALLLNKGDVISADTLEEITGHLRETDAYRLALLTIVELIQTIREEVGDPVVVRHEKHGLRVLTDPEASEYLDKRHRAHLEGIDRAYYKTCRWVDTAHLTDAERGQHAKRRLRQGFIDQALRPVRNT
jgi:hypothetical protein